MISVKQLQAFLAVAETGNFNLASRRLNMTQPTISKRISELELILQIRLFERTTRRCQVTSQGRSLIHYARRILDDVGIIQSAAAKRSKRSILAGHVRLGIIEAVALIKFPELLQTLNTKFPGLQIHVEIGKTRDHLRKIHNHELDVALVVSPIVDKKLISEPFWNIEASWIAAGPRWDKKPLTIEKLADYPLIVQSDSQLFPTIERWFKSKGVC